MAFDILLFLLGILAGAVASITGFGIGSFLTPFLALRNGFGVAVAAVSIAHFLGSSLRFWLLRHAVNRRTLISFGLLSAGGGLLGGLLQAQASGTILSVVFGCLVIFAGVSSLLHWANKAHVNGRFAWVVGVVSGFFGGLVGNQGGLRAIGLLSLNLKKTQLVATATAVAVIVDIFRVPVYIAIHPHQLSSLTLEIALMSLGVIAGTLLGAPLLRRLPEKYFRTFLAFTLIAVGIFVLARLWLL